MVISETSREVLGVFSSNVEITRRLCKLLQILPGIFYRLGPYGDQDSQANPFFGGTGMRIMLPQLSLGYKALWSESTEKHTEQFTAPT